MKKIFTFSVVLLLTKICAVAQLPYNTTMTKSHFTDGNTTIKKQGTTSWDEGVRLGDKTWGGFTYDDKYIDIALPKNGVASEITATTWAQDGTTGVEFYVSASPDNNTYTKLKSYDKAGNIEVALPHDTKYLRLCYSGNFSGSFKNIVVAEAKYFNAPVHTEWIAPTATVGSTDEVAFTTMEWCNTTPAVLSIAGEGASQFTYAISNNASLNNYGTATISATYKHNIAGTHNAVLTVSTAFGNYEIRLSGTTTKKDQTIAWADDLLSGKLPLGKEVATPATALSGLAITYTSSNEDVIAVTNAGTGIKAISAGQATVVATQVGNEEWNEVADSIVFTVTEKKIQYIHWVDNLTRLKTGSEPVELTATASILVNAETEETQDAPERTALITYTSADESVVTVDGNVLIINGEGETTLTATLPGDDIYEEASISMPVRVRVPSSTCEAYVLDAPDEGKYSADTWGEYEVEEEISGPAGQLTFEAKKQYVLGVPGIQNVRVQQYVNGGWSTIEEIDPGKNYASYGPYDLDRNAKKIRFCTQNGSYYRYFKNVLVTQATYLETTTPAITIEKSIVGDHITKTIAVQYSNLSEGVIVSNVSDKVILSTSELATYCGKYGEEIITLTVRPTEVGTIQDTVTIHDEATGLTLTIPVTIHTQRKTQTITWEDSIDVVYATDDITLTATAVNAIHYTSSDSTIAYVNEANQLIIQSIGSVTITAHAVESAEYQVAELSKNITILPAVPVVEELPTVEPVGYGVALTNDMLVGGKVSVEGAFVWNLNPEQKLVPGEYNLPIQFIPTSPIFGVIDTTVVVTVLKGKQTIVWNDDFSEVYVTDTLYLNATAKTEIYYEITDWEMASIDENQLVFFKAGDLRVDAIAKEDDFYYGDTLSVVITIKPEEVTDVVTNYPTATSVVYGQMLDASVLEGGVATIDGEFKWNDGAIQLPVGTHWALAVFVPAQPELYANVEFMVEVVVAQAPQTIDWAGDVPAMLELGDTIALTAAASSELAIVYEFDVEGVVEIDGDYMIAVGEGIVTITATQDGVDEFGEANYLPATPVSYTITVIKSDVNTGVESVETNGDTARKVIRNGQLYVIRGEHIYNALGSVID